MGGPSCLKEVGQVCKLQRGEATGTNGILREARFDLLHTRDRFKAVVQEYYLMLLGSRMRYDGRDITMTWKSLVTCGRLLGRSDVINSRFSSLASEWEGEVETGVHVAFLRGWLCGGVWVELTSFSTTFPFCSRVSG